MHHPTKASFCILFFPVLNLWSIVFTILCTVLPLFSPFCVLSFHCFHHFVYCPSIVFTILCTVLSHSAVDTFFFRKLWWLFPPCFAEVLQMNDLLNREHFSHALTYCVCDTTCNWASVLMFQCRYDNAAVSPTYLAMGMLYFPVFGKLIKSTVWIWCSDT